MGGLAIAAATEGGTNPVAAIPGAAIPEAAIELAAGPDGT